MVTDPTVLPLVWKTPWWKRVLMMLVSAAFVAGSLLAFFTPQAQAAGGKQFILLACALFFVWTLGGSLRMPRETLIADAQGITPVFVPKKYRRKIGWNEIQKIEIVTQKVRGSMSTATMLAVYLGTTETFGVLAGGAAVQTVAGSSMSDGGTANIYIPSIRLSEPLTIVLEKLNVLKQQYVSAVQTPVT